MATGRYAPSPSGDLHVGNLRTAMLAWLFAHSSDSELRLRIDDLDPATHDSRHESGQLADLAAIGIGFTGPIVRQSDRFDAYHDAIADLEHSGLTYPCYCTRREIREATTAPHAHLPEGAYPGTCRELSAAERAQRGGERPAALRVRADAAEIIFVDGVYGATMATVDDFVVRRNDGVPAYNLATVVDDDHQHIEQVVRGADLRTGTVRQIWLRGELGLEPIDHAHVPLIVNAAGDRLAKRDGAVTLGDLAAMGVSAGQVRAHLARSLGLDADPTTTLDELLADFDATALPTGPFVWTAPDTPDTVRRTDSASPRTAAAQKKASDTE